MRKQTPRIAFTPSGPVRLALDQLHEVTGRSRAELVSEMLDAMAPVFVEQLLMMEQLAKQPEKAREYVQAFGMHGIQQISQQLLDLPPVRPKRGRPRKDATKS